MRTIVAASCVVALGLCACQRTHEPPAAADAACNVGHIRRWKFPEPKPVGGVVQQTFPWIFLDPDGGETDAGVTAN